MPQVFIGLGANLGQPALNIKEALIMLDAVEGIEVVRVSSLYYTQPVGYTDQPWFHNCVAQISTGLSPLSVLDALQKIENALGRVRTVRWGPRTVDLDILLYDKIKMDSERLTIPHPRMQERAFVMVPLAELAGDFILPDGNSVNIAKSQLRDLEKCCCIGKELW